MQKTGLWKQIVLSALLIAAAGLLWQNRSALGALINAEAPAGSGPSAADTGAGTGTGTGTGAGTPVIVANVTLMHDDLTFSTIGTGIALRSVTLRAPASGEITAMDLAPGRRFAAGDTLVTLDGTNERLAVALAEARLERATTERDRFAKLEGSGATATARLEDAQTAYKVARIELDKARADLADRTLRAPFDGVSGLAQVEMGDRIAEDDVIASFDDRSRILVEFDLPEALLGRIAIGQPVAASTPSAERRSLAGEITAINSRVDPVTRTARIRAAIDNSADNLRPGSSFSLRIDLPGGQFPAVPELSLQFSGEGLHVWRVQEGEVKQVELRLVRRRAGLVIVDGPLSEGDTIVVEGTQRLRAGARVNILNTATAGSS